MPGQPVTNSLYFRSCLAIMALVCLSFLPVSCSETNTDGGGQSTAQNTQLSAFSENTAADPARKMSPVITGAEVLVTEQLKLLNGKSVAIVANQTSLVFGGTHLVDTLFSLGVEIRRIFAPEHGFRGDHDAGAQVSGGKDARTGLEIASLYGRNKKPTEAMLHDVDVVLFDIQDVGARFYTYISSMSYVMEACAEQHKQFIVLDRPNPNGWYVDGPVMQDALRSFVGMHEVPIVHGMTVGEYAKMVNAEGWLKNGARCLLTVVRCKSYTHSMHWSDTGLDWVPPSPNLPTEYSAYLYPMLCWFEGLPVSVGRGTETPFEVFGAPWHEGFRYSWRKDSVMGFDTPSEIDLFGLRMAIHRFTPVSMPGKAGSPKFQDQLCWGARFTSRVEGKYLMMAGLSLLQNFQKEKGNVNLQQKLFQPFFDKLVGDENLKRMIESGMEPKEIYESWQKDVRRFKSIREKYLLYPDFPG